MFLVLPLVLSLVACAGLRSAPTPSPEVTLAPEPISRPAPSERVPRVTIEELLQKMESKANILVVDSREQVETEFDVDHIKGAVPVPLSAIIAGEWLPPPDKEIILYCA